MLISSDQPKEPELEGSLERDLPVPTLDEMNRNWEARGGTVAFKERRRRFEKAGRFDAETMNRILD